MLSKKKIRLMSRMAMYEKRYGREDMKITTYYKKDYSSINTWLSIFWVTAGYIILALLLAYVNMDLLLLNLTTQKLIFIIAAVVAAYVIILILYGSWAKKFYNNKHTKAKQRVKKHYRDLNRLEKMCAKENDRR